MMDRDVDLRYREQLTASDLRLIAGAVGSSEPVWTDRSVAPAVPDLDSVLGRPELEHAVLAGAGAGAGAGARLPDGPGLIGASPFLTFAVAVHRTADRLQATTFVEERWTARRRVPVFDVASLRDLLGAPRRRYFLVELLASYTHVVSGATWQRTRRGWRRQRFSELDLSRMAELLEAVPPAEQPGVYRRLGDLALFLTGVFPDHSALADLGPVGVSKLTRLSRLGSPPRQEGDDVALLEELGRRWYALAVRAARRQGAPSTTELAVVGEMGERFRDARRALNVVTDWYLFPLRERWFGIGG